MSASRPEKTELDSSLVVHRKAIYRYILCMVRRPEEAEDLTQESFLRAHHKRAGLEDPAKLLPWLYRIATNVCHDRFRQGAVSSRLHSLDERSHSDDGGPETDPADEQAPRLDKLMEQDEMGTCVRTYLIKLPHTYRAVMMLHDVEGMTNPEISELLNISLATVKIRLHRGRERLRAALNEACLFSTDERGVTVCEPHPAKVRI